MTACQSTRDVERAAAPERGPSPAEFLLDRSIAFHDPAGVWSEDTLFVRWTSAGPDGTIALDFQIDMQAGGAFELVGEYGGAALEYRATDGGWTATVDGESELDDEQLENAGLAREDGQFWRNYFGFLGGLPMNLRDSSVQLQHLVEEVEFGGRTVLALRAGFRPEVGTDSWTFYFEPATAELVGCRFDRADPSRDGETLVFEELVSIGELRLPKRRTWYLNADDKLLGVDELYARTD